MLDFKNLKVSDKQDKYFANIDVFCEDETQIKNILLCRKTIRFETLQKLSNYFKNVLGVDLTK